jgi:hypothetical protein
MEAPTTANDGAEVTVRTGSVVCQVFGALPVVPLFAEFTSTGATMAK